MDINTDHIVGNWQVIKGKVKENWGKLTDDELTQINGEKDQLVGLIQKKYGDSREQAHKKVDEFFDALTD